MVLRPLRVLPVCIQERLVAAVLALHHRLIPVAVAAHQRVQLVALVIGMAQAFHCVKAVILTTGATRMAKVAWGWGYAILTPMLPPTAVLLLAAVLLVVAPPATATLFAVMRLQTQMAMAGVGRTKPVVWLKVVALRVHQVQARRALQAAQVAVAAPRVIGTALNTQCVLLPAVVGGGRITKVVFRLLLVVGNDLLVNR